MTVASGVVELQGGDWNDAFRRLDEIGGGVVRVPPGTHSCQPTRIDLADYEPLDDNVGIRGWGVGASVLDFGSGPGDGFTLVDSNEGDFFYIEITGVGFQGRRDGVLFRLGRDDFADAYNSCTLAFSTNNGSSDATGACRLNHVLNSVTSACTIRSEVSRSNSANSNSGVSGARRAVGKGDRWFSTGTHWRTS
jgi:hypothetical protein